MEAGQHPKLPLLMRATEESWWPNSDSISKEESLGFLGMWEPLWWMVVEDIGIREIRNRDFTIRDKGTRTSG